MTLLMDTIDATLRVMARNKLSVFLFHGVPETPRLLSDQLSLADFEQVIDFVSHRFQVIPLDAAVRHLTVGKLPAHSACITFDDGYSSWFDGAVQLLERRNLHATFFITTGQFDGLPMWHERVARAVMQWPSTTFELPGFGLPSAPLATLTERQNVFKLIENFLKYQNRGDRDNLLAALERAAGVHPLADTAMKLSELRCLSNRGFGIGAHTVSHPILSLCDKNTAMQEIGGAREFLQGITGAPVNGFAYPNGRPLTDFGHDHVDLVKAAGYTHAVTTQWSAANEDTPVFEIPRFTPWGPSQKQMALQIGRNLINHPKLTSVKTVHPPEKEPVVMYVENGNGFGGAVVALQNLLTNMPADSFCHVVSNLPIGEFNKIKSVRSHTVIGDRAINLNPLVTFIQSLQWGRIGRVLLFSVGRIDDLFNRLPYILRLAAHALRTRPDIIHGNNEPSSNREAMLIARFLRVPYVQHLRGPLGVVRQATWLLAQPNAFIPVSRWLAGDLLTTGVNAGRIRHVYDAVQFQASKLATPESTLRDELNLPPNTILVAMVGMMVSWKGQDHFIEAVSQLHQANPHTKFLIIGDTPERGHLAFAQSLQEQVRKLGLQQYIVFTGRRDDMALVLPQIDIVVSASKSPEPLGLVMLEAMGAGCVFIGPAFGAVPEVVTDGENGYTFTPNNPSALAASIQRALQHRADDQSMRERARKTIASRFCGRRCAAETAMVYQTLLTG